VTLAILAAIVAPLAPAARAEAARPPKLSCLTTVFLTNSSYWNVRRSRTIAVVATCDEAVTLSRVRVPGARVTSGSLDLSTFNTHPCRHPAGLLECRIQVPAQRTFRLDATLTRVEMVGSPVVLSLRAAGAGTANAFRLQAVTLNG
jgi:hypothetical protein